MIPLPPRSTLFPYTTLFRSTRPARALHSGPLQFAVRARLVAVVRKGLIVVLDIHPDRETDLLQIARSEEHTSELQSLTNLVCRLLLEKKKTRYTYQCQLHTR